MRSCHRCSWRGPRSSHSHQHPLQRRQGRSAVVGHADQIDGHHGLPLGGRGVGSGCVVAHGSVVDQDVQATELSSALLHRGVRGGFVSHVGLHAQHARVGQGLNDGLAGALQGIRVGIHQQHRSAFLAEQGRGRCANSGTCPRDQRGFAAQSVCAHARSLRLGTGVLDHLAPAHDLCADPVAELPGRAGDDLELHVVEPLLDVR